MLNFTTIKIQDANIILGQAHFIKTAEDLHEALVNAVPNIKFGLAFCESSGPSLVRTEGNDPELKSFAANPLEVIIAETEQGRGIVGVVDGSKSKAIETDADVKDRKEFLRKIGYKL